MDPQGAGVKVFLIADVRGYTRFTQERGDEAGARLASMFADIARAGVEASGGSLVELRGDEALAVFGSPRQAVTAALALQSRFVEASATDPDAPLGVGIGLDAGEAVPVGSGYRGAPLNVAARLCSLAGQGEILASQEVVHLAGRVDGARFFDRGPTQLKGITHPVHVVKVVDEAGNPYKGLRAFDEDDASEFFGRQTLIDEIIARLSEDTRGSRFLAVVGPSGSGKSSVIRAGVIPAIRRGALGAVPRVEVIVPGQEPKKELATALGADDETRSELVLVIDQFEEIFTLVEDENVRREFLHAISEVIGARSPLVRVIVTLRADFYDRPLLYQEFGRLIAERTQAVTALTPDELERAISGPAARSGVSMEQGLVSQIITDVIDRPGSLPLLQYALTELFDNRSGKTMTVAAYREIGGVSGALIRRAEALYQGVSEPTQQAVRQLFLRLAATEEDAGVTRRRVARETLLSIGTQGEMEEALETFGTARLLSFDRDPRTGASTVEVAHEALLVQWPRLSGWLDAAREDLRTQRRLALATREWNEEGRDSSFLVTGPRFLQLQAWRETSDLEITQQEREYLDASAQEHEARESEEKAREARERELEKRSVRRLRTLVVVMAVAALIAGAITVFAFDQQHRAESEARNAQARELAAASLANLETDPELSILLAEEAIEVTRSADGTVLREAEEALHRAVGASRIEMTVKGIGGDVAWGANGTFVTEGPEDTGLIDIRDAGTGERTISFKGHEIDVNTVSYSSDGSMLASTGDDGALKIWDPESGEPISSFKTQGEVWGASFSKDGSLVSASWPQAGIVRVMDPSSGRIVQEISAEGEPFDTDLSPDGRYVAIAQGFDRFVFVHDVRTGDLVFEITHLPYGVIRLDWSPDGKFLAGASNDGSVFVWDGKTGAQVRELIGHTGIAVTVDWSPDSKRLLSGGSDGTAKVWELRPHGERELMSLSAAGTRDGALAAFSPDGSRVIIGNRGATSTSIWDVSVAGDSEWGSFPTEELAPVGMELLPNGDVVAPIDSGSAAVWDVDSGRRLVRMQKGEDSTMRQVVRPALIDLAATSDGEWVAGVPNFSGYVSVWDTSTGRIIFDLDLQTEVTDLAWSPDDAELVVATFGSLRIFDREGNQLQQIDTGVPAWGVDFDPQGGSFLTASGDGQNPSLVTRWTRDDQGAYSSEKPVERARGVNTIAVDPSGETIATAYEDGSIDVFDDDLELLTNFSAKSGPISTLDFSPDGDTIATGGEDGTVRLFSVSDGTEKLLLAGHRYLATAVEFSQDGTRLASASADGVARVWAVDLADLLNIASDNVTRELTDQECQTYLHQDEC